MRGLDITNQTFGRLQALKRAPKPSTYRDCRKAFWMCKCECGNEVVVLSEALRNGRTQSCGCLKSDKLSKRGFIEPGLAGFKKLYRRYKQAASHRQLEFTLTEEDFRLLTSSRCFYCGCEPSQNSDLADVRDISMERIEFGRYTYNGVDRVNPDHDYTNDNCVACCAVCNRMKSDMSLLEFRDHIRMVDINMNG